MSHGRLHEVQEQGVTEVRRAAALRARPRVGRRRILSGMNSAVALAAVDALTLLFAVALSLQADAAADLSGWERAALWFFAPLALIAIYIYGGHRPRLRPPAVGATPQVIAGVSIAAAAEGAVLFVANGDSGAGPSLARAWVFGVILVAAGRSMLAFAHAIARARGVATQPTLIVGAGQVGTHLARRLFELPDYGLRPVGFLDPSASGAIPIGTWRVPVLGDLGDLGEAIERTGARHVMLAFSAQPDRGLVPLVRRCQELGVEVSLVPRLYESVNGRMGLEHLGGTPLLSLSVIDPKGWQFAIKHGFDRVFATVALVAVAPVLAAIALGVKLQSPGASVLFRQRRVGRDGQAFDLLKFRTMQPPRGPTRFVPSIGLAPGGVEGEDRRTTFGRVLRRSSLDELPQLLNVLRGQMSIVGPRPERPEFVELFADDVDRYADRHRVKSGITGWAQVHGLRGQTSIADRVEWDNWYIENWSLWLDFKIIARTVLAVFRHGEP